MAEDDNIRYRDILEPDDSIEKLTAQLEGVEEAYKSMAETVKVNAMQMVKAMESVSGATADGRKQIGDSEIGASRLAAVQKELKIALSATGQEIARLKVATTDVNRYTADQKRYISEAVTSYNQLKLGLKQAVSVYKGLTAEQRANSQAGQDLINSILSIKNQLSIVDAQLKPHIQTLTEVEKAEQRLVYLQSEEGQKLIDLKAKITEVTNARRQQKIAVDPVAEAERKLTSAQSESNIQLKLLTSQTAEANRVAKLQAQVNGSAANSFNRLSAQYELNKIKLNAMSIQEVEATATGRALLEETNQLYLHMTRFQESTGNYKLSVGKYQNAWSGLGFSVSQVVRELPAAAINLNTFFLAISNNIPMVMDEIRKLQAKNIILQKQGKETVSIGKTIAKSLFSWNTALVVLLAAFSIFGDKITAWIGKVFKGKEAALTMGRALKAISKELENVSDTAANNIISFKDLQKGWLSLKDKASKTKWIEDNKTAFNNLGISITSVNDAETVFVEKTQAVLDSLKLRAKAEAAKNVATEQYKKAFEEEEKARLSNQKAIDEYYKKYGEQSELSVNDNRLTNNNLLSLGSGAYDFSAGQGVLQGIQKQLNASLEVANTFMSKGDAYFNMSEDYLLQADKVLTKANIKIGTTEPNEPKGRDLIDLINKNNITIQQQYEESITKLQKDEYAKRRKESVDQVQEENNKLHELYRRNVGYIEDVNGKYKELSTDQKALLSQQQRWITDTIANNLKLLALQLKQIENEQAINTVKIQREMFAGNIDVMAQSLSIEQDLVLANLKDEYSLVLDTNRKLREEGDTYVRTDEEVLMEYEKERIKIISQYDQEILTLKQKNIEAQLDLVKKGTSEELALLIEQNEISRKLAITENAAKPAEQQIDKNVINAGFDKSERLIAGSFNMDKLFDQQELDKALFNETKRSSYEIKIFELQQERDRWQTQIALAKSGGLDWSQDQIETAEATSRAIDRELKDTGNIFTRIGKNGIAGTLLENLGFDDDSLKAMEDSVNFIVEQINTIMDAEIEAKEKAVEIAEARVDAAKSAYDAEVEARNNGYANNVATAKRELAIEQKKQTDKQRLLEEAKRRQEKLDSLTQASSLTTASANIWSSLSSIPILGPIMAIAAIGTMWTSFIAAKAKAKRVSSSQEYGEGGLEFLEGGSHASGNDIDLGIHNKHRKRMRVEGGEALAIINKRKTAKYHKILPDVIDSFNKGIFEDKYLGAFNKSSNMNIINNTNKIDLSNLESDVRRIRKYNESNSYVLPDGTIIVQQGNVKRIIRN